MVLVVEYMRSETAFAIGIGVKIKVPMTGRGNETARVADDACKWRDRGSSQSKPNLLDCYRWNGLRDSISGQRIC